MTISALQAAKVLCLLSNWNISNLQLQKMLYFAHMFYLGRTKNPLIKENFEAWNYGPVIPSLYKKVSFFGSDNIVDIFPNVNLDKENSEYKILQEIATHLAHRPASELVAITHHPQGAWAKHYKPNIKHIPIPNSDIINEYNILYAN